MISRQTDALQYVLRNSSVLEKRGIARDAVTSGWAKQQQRRRSDTESNIRRTHHDDWELLHEIDLESVGD